MRKASNIKASRKRKPRRTWRRREPPAVKGGFVIDWAATKPSRPGEERGVIAIIKPAGGA